MDPRGDGRHTRADGTTEARTVRFTHPYIASTVRVGWTRRRTRGRGLALLVGYRLHCRGTSLRRT